ncbi:MAG: biosynthetic-type acetolactate synthase large subunit [Rikenellaceae bacterium]|jgi:acetolactate synthase-1/2/3 large subunit|nr:biosynthetic-type acetolactate synthase large subunit [Rikenellaceae bacterium]
MIQNKTVSGADALMLSLLEEGVDTLFGYPGGQIINVFDSLYKFSDRLHHILTRHEQGAVHAAQGYSRATGRVGVCVVTSGPGATNLITGIADAMIDSTPLVCITGQVPTTLLGSDAFQEADIISMTMPVTKWSYQVTEASEIPTAIAKAFFIARTGRPGPVLVDIPKNAQIGQTDFHYTPCQYIRSYTVRPAIDPALIEEAAQAINAAERPLILLGQGVKLSGAEQKLIELAEKAGIPVASTLMGLSAMPSDHPLYVGMVGMHGNIGPNVLTQETDLLIAVGMRFSDRITGDLKVYASQAKVIHIDIDKSEIGKNVKTDIGIHADVSDALDALMPLVHYVDRSAWIARFGEKYSFEYKQVIDPLIHPSQTEMTMGEVVTAVTDYTDAGAVVVTDVGQQQMMAARYSHFRKTRSFITSGGLGTMGYGLPAAIGAKIGVPERQVVLFVGDGGFQMTLQELGTIMQENAGVKMVILNNGYLGMVRQWQQLFFERRYSNTELMNPDFVTLASAYGIAGRSIASRGELSEAIAEMFADDAPYLLEVRVNREGNVFPMIPAGAPVSGVIFNE